MSDIKEDKKKALLYIKGYEEQNTKFAKLLMEEGLLKVLDKIDTEYEKALKEKRPEVDGYAHSYAILKRFYNLYK